MRVTNNMIMRNSSYNISGTKGMVNNSANQMTTQKKISRPSEDPVIAIRSLRLSTGLDRVNQYYKKNIPDAESWLDVTEAALLNMKTLMTDMRTLTVNGATDTLTQENRNTILSQLKALQQQIFAEGNADYAGRTVFTGYRTNKDLIFDENDKTTSYEIQEWFDSSDMESVRYYTGNVEVPTTSSEVMTSDISDTEQTTYYRLRTSYKNVDDLTSFTYSYGGTDYTPTNMKIYETEDEWAAATGKKEVANNEVVFIKETGHIILGEDVASEIRSNHAAISATYDKTGFNKGELRPEYYFNCTDKTDPANPISYEKYDADGNEIGYDINFTVAANQTITVNLEASDAFDSNILRDMDDMIAAVSRAMNAHDKISNIKAMMEEAQYDDDASQARLKKWLDAAQKEADYADDNLQKMFSSELGKLDGYLSNLNLAITKVGCTQDQLRLTKVRVSNQDETLQELQSQNDDLEISEIIIQYTAVYNAYQASLTAASRLGEMTLLNYIR